MVYIKLHSAGIGVAKDDVSMPSIIPPTFVALEDLVSALAEQGVKELTVERPFATDRANARIYYLFQLYGALKALCGHYGIRVRPVNISDVREALYGEVYLSKEFMLTEINNKFNTVAAGLLPVQELILFDVWTLVKGDRD